MVGLV